MQKLTHIPQHPREPLVIWLIGGTQESAQLAQCLSEAHLPFVVSVTTQAARGLYSAGQIWVGRLDPSSLPQFLKRQRIRAILDASHPFAIEISKLAMGAGLPYLRFERPQVEIAVEPRAAVRRFASFETLLSREPLDGRRVLLIVGYRPLSLFAPWQNRATLFARLLPSLTALQAALDSGFSPDRLIALRPPVPIELERALWQHWQIDTVICKASGAAGGEETKLALALELGTELLLVERPPLAYAQQTDCLEAAVAFCAQYC